MKLHNMLRLAHLWRDRRWEQIAPQAHTSVQDGHRVSFDYLPRPIRSLTSLDAQLAHIDRDIAEAASLFPGCHWSMKPDVWGVSTNTEIFRSAATHIGEVCQASGVALRIDTSIPPYDDYCFRLALSLPNVQPVLAINHKNFTANLAACIDADRTPRLVKGYSEAHESEYTVSDRMAQAVTALWQAKMSAAIATHDMTLIKSIMKMPGYRTGQLEVEMVANLVTPQQLMGLNPDMFRLYYPYGAGAGLFFVKRVLRSPMNRHAVLRATHNK